MNSGSRAAVLRRREGTCFSSLSDDEVGACPGVIRVERAQRAEQSTKYRIAPRTVLRRREGTCFSSPSDDEVGACPGVIRVERAQRAEQSTQQSNTYAVACGGSDERQHHHRGKAR